MDAFISIFLMILLIALFGDILFQVICRFIAFFICLWLAMHLHHRLARLVIDVDLTQQPHWAAVIAFVVVMGLCWFLLRCVGVRVRDGAVGDGEAVALDAFRIGLVCVICFAIFLILSSLSSGTLLLVSWIWLSVLAICVAGIDVCCPTAMSRAARWFE